MSIPTIHIFLYKLTRSWREPSLNIMSMVQKAQLKCIYHAKHRLCNGLVMVYKINMYLVADIQGFELATFVACSLYNVASDVQG